MVYTLLAGGYRTSIVTLSFDGTSLETISECDTPESPSWVAVRGKYGYTVNEVERDGDAVFLSVEDGEVAVLQRVLTGGAPCHVLLLDDRAVFSNYMSGTVTSHSLTPPFARLTNFALPYAYEGKTPPNAKRQEGAHAHHALHTPRGVFVCDLGSDRVYLLNEGLEGIVDWIQCSPGFGPRHAALSPDESTIYVLGELGHAVEAYPLQAGKSTPTIDSSYAWVPPPMPKEYTTFMDSAEIVSPCNGTVYASNRLEKHASEMNALDEHETLGDSVAIILYDANNAVEGISHVQTSCCCIRGMQVSRDAKYVAIAGQCAGGIEVYAISGERKEVWELIARKELDKVTDFAWL